MKISDRTLGYISLVALIGLFAFIAYCMWDAHHEATTIIEVDFNELGSLQPEDQVVIRGYTVGTIGNVRWLGDRARVQIKFSQPVVIREGTQFNNVNYAIMGQRRLEIVPSKVGKVLPNDYIHTGTFEPGIAEMLHLIENINEQISEFREMVHLLLEGDSTHMSATQAFESIFKGLEGTLINTENSLTTLQPVLNNLFAQIDSANVNMIIITRQADSTVKIVTDAVNEKITLAEGALSAISSGAANTNRIIDEIEANPFYNKFFYSSEMVDNVNDLVSKLNELVRAIDTKGIKVLDKDGNPVKAFTWKNLNIVGKTAREKAKERAEKGEKLPE